MTHHVHRYVVQSWSKQDNIVSTPMPTCFWSRYEYAVYIQHGMLYLYHVPHANSLPICDVHVTEHNIRCYLLGMSVIAIHVENTLYVYCISSSPSVHKISCHMTLCSLHVHDNKWYVITCTPDRVLHTYHIDQAHNTYDMHSTIHFPNKETCTIRDGIIYSTCHIFHAYYGIIDTPPNTHIQYISFDVVTNAYVICTTSGEIWKLCLNTCTWHAVSLLRELTNRDIKWYVYTEFFIFNDEHELTIGITGLQQNAVLARTCISVPNQPILNVFVSKVGTCSVFAITRDTVFRFDMAKISFANIGRMHYLFDDGHYECHLHGEYGVDCNFISHKHSTLNTDTGQDSNSATCCYVPDYIDELVCDSSEVMILSPNLRTAICWDDTVLQYVLFIGTTEIQPLLFDTPVDSAEPFIPRIYYMGKTWCQWLTVYCILQCVRIVEPNHGTSEYLLHMMHSITRSNSIERVPTCVLKIWYQVKDLIVIPDVHTMMEFLISEKKKSHVLSSTSTDTSITTDVSIKTNVPTKTPVPTKTIVPTRTATTDLPIKTNVPIKRSVPIKTNVPMKTPVPTKTIVPTRTRVRAQTRVPTKRNVPIVTNGITNTCTNLRTIASRKCATGDTSCGEFPIMYSIYIIFVLLFIVCYLCYRFRRIKKLCKHHNS